MNARILALISVLALASGCIIHNDGGGGGGPYYAAGNVTFSWTFGGGTCQQTPDVASVVIDIPGQTLSPNTFACLTNGYPGITLTNFAGGAYSFTVTAYDSQGTPLYAQSGTFTVDGNTPVAVDLAPTNDANSYAYLSWSFAAGSRNPQNAPTCGTSQTGIIPAVKVTIDGAATYYNCTDGLNSNAIQTGYLASGTHTLTIEAVSPGSGGAADYVYAGASTTLVTTAGAPASQGYTLQWTVGGAAVNWAFYSNNGTISYADCAAAGIDTIRVNFKDTTTGAYVYPYPAGDTFACPASNVALYNAIPAGTYTIEVDGYDSQSSRIFSNLNDVPQVTVQAGSFDTNADAPNPPIELDLQ